MSIRMKTLLPTGLLLIGLAACDQTPPAEIDPVDTTQVESTDVDTPVEPVIEEPIAAPLPAGERTNRPDAPAAPGLRVDLATATPATPEGMSFTPTQADTGLFTGDASVEDSRPNGAIANAVTIQLPDEWEASASGNRIRVTLKARASAPTTFAVGYSSENVGNSGWRTFEADETYNVFRFRYRVRDMTEANGDFIGILANTTGTDSTLEIAYIDFEIEDAE